MKVVLFDVDSKIPNLALMKLGSFYKSRGYDAILSRKPELIPADLYFASAVFNSRKSLETIDRLKKLYCGRITIGGTGADFKLSLTEEAECSFPDYNLYTHTQYALGFLTRGCSKRCAFCVVPKKEGRLQPNYSTFDDFVPKGQQNVMLLDNNLLASPNANDLLEEMAKRQFKVNFSQTLDIQYLTDEIYPRLKMVDSVNSRFTRKMIYFSCNTVKQAEWFNWKSDKIRGFGKGRVTAVIMYGFNTRLTQDFAMLKMMRKLGVLPFVQEYQPITGVPARIPDDYFDMDLDEVAEFRIRSNGQNGEKFLRYVSALYFNRYGRYYLPLLKATYRYNNKPRLQYYLDRPDLFSTEMYKRYV
jgi:MoaA/NifB/PqqE/SkfB family radical SAM enzyme